MQGEFEFLNLPDIDEKNVYNYIHNSFFSNKGCLIIIKYIKSNFIDCTENNCTILINRFTKLLYDSKIDLTKELYDEIKSKTNLLDNCIEIIINNNDKLNQLNEYSLDLIEYYYNNKDQYIDTINDIEENEEEESPEITINSSTIKEIQNIPLLSDQETYDYTTRYNETHDIKYRDLMVVHNLRLILPIANKYAHKSKIEVEDLLFEGVFGLIRALEDYDPNIAKFSTYATYWIEQKIRRYIYDKGSNIRIPVFKHEKLNKYKKVENSLFEKLGRKPSDKEIADELNIEVEKIDEYKKLLLPIKSLNEPVNGETEDEIQEFIPSDDKTPEQKTIDNNYLELYNAIKELNDDQKNVLLLRFGFYDGRPRTLSEVRVDLCKLGLKDRVITSERARQIEEKAIKILRDKLKNNNEELDDKKEKPYTDDYLNNKLLLLINIFKTTNDKLLKEILEHVPNFYIEVMSKYFDNEYNLIKNKTIPYNTKLILVKELLPRITNTRDRIISYSINNNKNGIILPTNIYVFFDHINDYIKTKECVNKCINNMDPAERYILGKYYDIYFDTGGLITTRITNEERTKLNIILRKIEFELPFSKQKAYKKKKNK